MTDTRQPDESLPSQTGGNRRRFLAAAGVVGVVAAGGATAGAASRGDRRERFVIEAAMLGETMRVLFTPTLVAEQVSSEADIAGSPFYLEGWLYPEGTISPGDGFAPVPEGSIGLITCRGHFLGRPGRQEPHIISHQEYHFGGLDGPLGVDMIGSQGFEGMNDPGWETLRMVTGGTGAYRSARGEVRQLMTGTNSSVAPGPPMPNFRLEFDLDLPS